MDEKRILNQQSRRHYANQTLKRGFLRVISSVKYFALFLGALALIGGLLCLLEALYPNSWSAFLYAVDVILFPLLALLCVFFFGYLPHSREYYDNLVRAGFTNDVMEAPYLIKREVEGKTEVFTFHCKGLPRQVWIENRELISNALNKYVVDITQGKRLQEIVVRCVDYDDVLGSVIPWKAEYTDVKHDDVLLLGRSLAGDVKISLETVPHLMVAAASGGGKTNLCICLLTQALQQGSTVYVYDGKGKFDYRPIAFSGGAITDDPDELCGKLIEIQNEIKRRSSLYDEVGASSVDEYRTITGQKLPRIVLMIDEASTVIDTHGKTVEEKARISKIIGGLSQIAQKGRAVGIHSIYAMQNPSRVELPSAVQVNLDKICGKADHVLSRMMLNSDIANEIPKDSHGIFYLTAGAKLTQFQAFYFKK